MNDDLRSRSRVILDGPDRAQARAYLKGIGFDDDALQRAWGGRARETVLQNRGASARTAGRIVELLA